MQTRIATWNVNSIKARTAHVQRWLERVRPDYLCLQELKGLEFPADAFAGYRAAYVGQKAYNGVAILSKEPVTVLLDKLPGDDADEQARYLEVEIGIPPSPSNPFPQAGGQGAEKIRLINIYLPNGNPWPGEKFDYKLAWMDRLYNHLKELREQEVPFVICGDFNVIPEERDCWDPAVWENDALFRIETRQKFRSLLNLGLTDAFRVFNHDAAQYTFWDYQAGCWPKNKGIRIDHFLASPPLADRMVFCGIDKEPRGEETPSDHTPVILAVK